MKLTSTAFYIFLIAIFLSPLAFISSTYIPLDLVKTIVIALGAGIPAALYAIQSIREKKLVLPPKRFTVVGVLLLVSLLVSSFVGIQTAKSFFGQGFETVTAGFIALLILSAGVAYTIVRRNESKVIVLYAATGASYILLFIVHAIRLIFGSEVLSLGILASKVQTIAGSWYDLGSLSLIVALMSLSALVFLPLSRSMKLVYWITGLISFVAAIVVHSPLAWFAAAIVALYVISAAYSARKAAGALGSSASFIKRFAFVPVIFFIVAAIFAYNGTWLTGTMNKLDAWDGAHYSEIGLPWQVSLDVASGALKASPLFGIGPNHFLQAYIAFRPASINAGDFWSAEFQNGTSYLATYIATQGLVGAALWILAIVFLGGLMMTVVRKLPADPIHRFLLVSSSSGAALVWILSIIAVPSHIVLFLGYVMTGIFLAVAVNVGLSTAVEYSPETATSAGPSIAKPLAFRTGMLVAAVVILLLVAVFAKKTIAMAYFGSGVKALSSSNPDAALANFKKAELFDTSDIYYQAQTEALLSKANAIASSVTANTPQASTTAIMSSITGALSEALADAQKAEAYDPNNYYNYLSEARVSEAAMSVKVDKAYDNAVAAYSKAIAANPLNPSLYVSLARVQATAGKSDDALKSLGQSLSVKNNYLDAVYLITQVEAAKGNAAEAITAAKFAIQLSPQNPLFYFLLGVLDYNSKDYSGAVTALESATKIQADYSNAKYFLGLSYARLGRTSDALAQFQDLAKLNPDNADIRSIIAALSSGRAVFSDSAPTAATASVKKASLPLKEKKK